ncbi:MAG TPA: cytoplasmic protein, partial [Nitrospiraceae bacterium]|nr:cytoplasmic protein [Nitrospiraceae bacterium]
MKNWMGVMGGSRRTIHQRLDESLVDLSMAIKPTLTILDAVRILTANGPQGGSLSDVKKMDTVIVGVDQVAVDSFGATLFGMKGSDLEYVNIGDRAGLGRMDISKLNVKRINV